MANTRSTNLSGGSNWFISNTSLSDKPIDNLSGDFTFEVWVKPSSAPSNNVFRSILSRWDSAGEEVFNVTYGNDGGTKKVFLDLHNGSSIFSYEWEYDLETSWYHLAIVWDSSSGDAELYVDAVSQGVVTKNITSLRSDSSSSFNIGEGRDSWWEGKIDEVRIWDNRRTESEISGNYRREIQEDTDSTEWFPGLIAYFRFENQTIDSETIDETGNHPNAEDSGFPTFDTDIPWGVDFSVNDSVVLSENVSMFKGLLVDVNDSVSVSESTSFEMDRSTNLSNSVTVSESTTLNHSGYHDINVNDSVTVGESVTVDVPDLGGVNVNDTVTLSESVTTENEYNINVSDNVFLQSPTYSSSGVNYSDTDNTYSSSGEGVVSLLLSVPGVYVYENDEEVTKLIQRDSLKFENVLTNQADRASFTIRKYGSNNTFTPKVGHEVEIIHDSDKAFAGVVVRVTQRADAYKIVLYDVEVEDYTRLLDHNLVADTFRNKTLGQVIDSIIDTYAPSDFTTQNVFGVDKKIDYIAFNYIQVSEALRRLADQINYDWYVDYNKDLHFFPKEVKQAPFDLADDDGSFIFESLRIRRDNTQMKNVVYVRGGEFIGNTITSDLESNGTQNIYNLPYRYDNDMIDVTVTGSSWNGGVDGKDDIQNHDFLWNNEEKFIRFRNSRIPSDGSSIKVVGDPFLPVRLQMKDEEAIADTASVEGGSGQYEYLIIDKSINSREAARDRALAELNSYKETISEGTFKTYTSGLRSGQRIRLNSSAHGIDEKFQINRVSAKMWTDKQLVYTVSLVSAKTFGMIEVLQQLLLNEKNNITINEDEIVDVARHKSENVSIDETVSTSTSHNPVSETVTASESVTERDTNYMTTFVAGPTTPTGTKRVFVLGGSPLGFNLTPDFVQWVVVSESVTVSIS